MTSDRDQSVDPAFEQDKLYSEPLDLLGAALVAHAFGVALVPGGRTSPATTPSCAYLSPHNPPPCVTSSPPLAPTPVTNLPSPPDWQPCKRPPPASATTLCRHDRARPATPAERRSIACPGVGIGQRDVFGGVDEGFDVTVVELVEPGLLPGGPVVQGGGEQLGEVV
ncbi:MAG: hypothetical protein ACRDRL_05035 [Sciscionella sp.]